MVADVLFLTLPIDDHILLLPGIAGVGQQHGRGIVGLAVKASAARALSGKEAFASCSTGRGDELKVFVVERHYP